jgi:hypothetical protein
MRQLRQMAVWALGAIAVMLPLQFLGATAAQAQPASFTPLTLRNGWANAPFGTSKAAVTSIDGIVYFKGAIKTFSTNTNMVPFILPANFRPLNDVHILVDLCNASEGHLYINFTGAVSVQAEKTLSDARCFTSLDGASFAPLSVTSTPFTLVNGWTNAPARFGTSKAGARIINGIVHFNGAIRNLSTNTNMVPFTLPVFLRPHTNVYLPVDLCNAEKGRLFIKSTGAVSVQAEKTLSFARCLTSLDGASFATSGSSFTPLTLVNGWANAPFGTSKAAVRIINGIVHFKGAIKTFSTNTNMVPFTLPAGFRPHTNVYIPVDLCDANKGRLFIQPRGLVTVQAEKTLSDARCFTSLDGASFAP